MGSLEEIRGFFPNAEVCRTFLAKQSVFLEERYGFTPDNTLFAEGGCSDEINEPEYRLMATYWGERFKFGGLAGYCHAGKSGLAAVSHHIPGVSGAKNLLLLCGAHIGYHGGEWGRVIRYGQTKPTASCGSLAAVLAKGHVAIEKGVPDPLDAQQQTVEKILLPYLKDRAAEKIPPDMVSATRYLMNRIDRDLLKMVHETVLTFDGRIAVVSGITINTEKENYFSPSHVSVYGGEPIAYV